MILSTKTKESIMNVHDYYEKRNQSVDMNYVTKILEIIQKEEAFKETLKYEFVKERSYGSAYAKGGTVYFNMDLLTRYLKRLVDYSFSEYPKEDINKYYHFMTLHILFHESSHAWQQNGLEKFSEINRLHYDTCLTRKFPLKEFLKAIKLQINELRLKDHAYFERQANIDACRELIDMYQGYEFLDFIELQHIYNLSIRPKGASLVHDTLHALFLEYNYNCQGIPEDLLFEVGLPTDKKYSDVIYSAIEEYYQNQDELSYRRVIEKIKKI